MIGNAPALPRNAARALVALPAIRLQFARNLPEMAVPDFRRAPLSSKGASIPEARPCWRNGMAKLTTEEHDNRRKRRNSKLIERVGKPYINDGGLSMVFVPGVERPRELLITVSGANLRIGNAPEEELLGTQRHDGQRAALIVADTTLSSFTNPALVDRLQVEVERAVERLGRPRVLIMGSSIGGHGALHLANRLGAEAALGFAPIFSTDVRVHHEDRWAEGQKRLHPDGMATIGDDMSTDCRYVAIFAANRAVEQRHYAALSRVPGIEVHLIREGGHRIARELHKHGVLTAVIDAVFAGAPMPVAFNALLADEATTAEARNIIADEIAPNGKPYGPWTDPNMPPPAAAVPGFAAAAPS